MVLISFRLTRLLIKEVDDLVVNCGFESRADVFRTAILNLLILEGNIPKSYFEALRSNNDAAPSMFEYCKPCYFFSPAIFDAKTDECISEPECLAKKPLISSKEEVCEVFTKKKELIEIF